MKPVVSSNIAAIGYDPSSRNLRVRFPNGAQCVYVDVPADKVGLLMTAPSIGGYFASQIKPHHRIVSTKLVAGGEVPVTLEIPAQQLPKSLLQTAQDDDCCKPLKCSGIAQMDSWSCPQCGCQWKPTTVGTIRHWAPVDQIQVFRIPGT